MMDSVPRIPAALGKMAMILCCIGVSSVSFALGSDFQPNCNMRRLALNNAQRDLLREIRIAHRQQENISIFSRKQQESIHRQNIARLLQEPDFNPGLARHYVTEYYRSGIQNAVDNLADQHRIFQALTPAQKKIWLQDCLY